MTTSDRLAALLHRSHDDPVFFAHAILGLAPFDPDYPEQGPLWSRQVEAARMAARYHTCIFPWGNSLGKTFLESILILWWLYTRDEALVITTAPTWQQLQSVLWKNIRRMMLSSHLPMGGKLTKQPLELDLGDGRKAIGISTTSVERLSGHHSKNLIFVGDEASGIEEEIFEASDGLVPIKVWLFGNPLRAEGRFRHLANLAIHQEGDASIPDHERVVCLRVPSTESPDIDCDVSNKGLASGAWLRRQHRQYGKGSLWVRCHVDAMFPDLASDVLIPPEWLDQAYNTPRPQRIFAGPNRMSIDLGEGVGRDRSVIAIRDDRGFKEFWSENGVDLAGTAGVASVLRHKHEILDWRITYDALGIGQDFVNHLAGHGITNATPYYGSASGGSDYTNLRTAAAWRLRQRLDPDVTLDPPLRRSTGTPDPDAVRERQASFHISPTPLWEGLRRELLALKYELVGTKVKLILKTDLAKILGHSPDLGDAAIQSFAFEE